MPGCTIRRRFAHPQESMRLEICGGRFASQDSAGAATDDNSFVAQRETRLAIAGFFRGAEMEAIPWTRAVLEFSQGRVRPGGRPVWVWVFGAFADLRRGMKIAKTHSHNGREVNPRPYAAPAIRGRRGNPAYCWTMVIITTAVCVPPVPMEAVTFTG